MSFAEELVKQINELRTNPKGYAKRVNKYVSYFKDKTLQIPGSDAGIQTEEGAAAYIEAFEFLSKQKGIDPLEPSKGLQRICEDYMVEAQKVDPDQIDNINLEKIMEKYGSFSGDLNRAFDFGGEDPEQVLVNLIVCDGDPDRGNRESLLSPDLKKIGVANAKNDTYRFCTLIISCTKFKNKVDSDDIGFIGDNSKKGKKEENKKSDEEEGKPKPTKVILKDQPKKEIPQNEYEYEEEVPPDGVISECRSEKIVTENGKKKRVIKIVRTMKDGTKETETIKEAFKEN